jgi:hypothetical protein
MGIAYGFAYNGTELYAVWVFEKLLVSRVPHVK